MDSLIRQASRLHSASGVARSVIEITSKDDFDLRELASCIEIDPALTSRVFAIVNSARYGFTNQVSSVPQAMTLLGRNVVRNIALTFSVVEAFTKGLSAEMYTDYWCRSLTTSLVASTLAARSTDVEVNDAYTAGLLADIGILVLAQFEEERYLPLYAQYAHTALVDAEREVFGFDHAEVGSRLLDAWQLPPMVSLAVAAHHDENESSELPLARLVRAGNLMPAVIWEADTAAFEVAYSWFESQLGFDTEGFISLAIEVNKAVVEEAKVYQVAGIEPVDSERLEREAWRIISANCRLQ